MSARRTHQPQPFRTVASTATITAVTAVLAAVVMAATFAPAHATPKAGASTDMLVSRLLSRSSDSVKAEPKGGAAPCLHTQARKALAKGKAPDADRTEKACNVSRVVVSRLARTTAPGRSRTERKAAAATLVGMLRTKAAFASALDKYATVAAATTLSRGRLVAVAIAATAPIKADPTLAGGNQAPTPRPTARIDYRTGDKTVILDGTASTDDKQIVSYEWTLLTTTSTTIKTPIGTGPVLVWNAPAYATHSFTLTVTDAQGAVRTSTPISLDVWRWTTRSEFLAGLRDALNSTRTGNGLKALTEQSCLTTAAQQHADLLADQHAGAPIDTTALTTTCKRTVRGVHTDTDDYDYNLRIRAYSSPLAAAAMTDAQTTTYGLGFAHSKDGPGYYLVLIAAA